MQRKLTAFALLMTLTVGHPAMAGKFNKVLSIGDDAPTFKDLMGIDGKKHSLSDYRDKDVLIISFTCNHCPVAQAYEPRVKALLAKYADKPVAFIAINCSLLPSDTLDEMKKRAKEQKLTYDYLHDPSQDTGRNYGATVTPHMFVLDKKRRVAYMGAFDDSFIESRIEDKYVEDAVAALFAGKEPEVTESRQKGCSIQYERKVGAFHARPADDAFALADAKPVELNNLKPGDYAAELKKHRGNVVLVDFWATWCLACRKGFPETVELHKSLSQKGLRVVSISLDEPDADTRAKALSFLTKQKATFPNYISSVGSDEEAMAAFKISDGALPHYKIYSRDGKLVRTFGFDFDKPIDHDEIKKTVQDLVGKKL